MSVQVIHAPLHTPESARGVIAAAIEIADDYDRDSVAWKPVFEAACALIGARASTFVQPQTVDMPVFGLKDVRV